MEEHLYPHFYKVEKQHWWFAARQDILEQYIATRVPTSPATRVLDVGCGTGSILEMFSKNFEAHGLDFSESAVAFCRERGLRNLHCGTLASFHADRPFDLITMLDMVEHVDDDHGLLSDTKRLLADNGHLLVTVPAFPSLWGPHDVLVHHKRRYTRTQFAALMSSTGYDILHLSFFNTFLFPVAVAQRWAARLMGGKGGEDLEIPAAPVNALFRRVFALESPLLSRGSLPFGLSLICLARKRP